jgi:Tol biopolymer transport system component
VIEPVSFPEYALIRWSPDSRAISYIVTRRGVSNLWRSPIDGGAPARLTHFTADRIFRFAWSRDGKSLACERGLTIGDVVLIKPGD